MKLRDLDQIELGTSADAARLLRLSRERVRQLAQTEGFPKPLGKLGNSVIWNLNDVREWATNR